MIFVIHRDKSVKGSRLQFYAGYTLSYIDDVYDKLKRDIGNDFHRAKKDEKFVELHSLVAVIAATGIYMTLRCLPVLAKKRCRASGLSQNWRHSNILYKTK